MIETMTKGITAKMHDRTNSLSSTRFEWIVTLFSTWVTGGLYLDGWAHEHGRVDNTFFTPWHALLYGGVFALALFLSFHQLRNMRRGHAWQRSLPEGYLFSLAGSFLFLIGGGLDFIWHSLFGFEVNLEALLSPTHLLLATSGVLMISGPLRAARHRERSKEAGSSSTSWPMVLSMTMILMVIAFFTVFTHPFDQIYAGKNLPGNLPSSAAGMARSLSIAGILLQTAFLMGVILFLAQGNRLPVGALTLIIGVSNASMTVFHERFELIPAAILSGIIADLLYSWLQPTRTRRLQLSLFTFFVPIILYSLYYLTIQLTQGIGWTIHLWLGSIFMAGITGLFISFLVASPEKPASNMVREQE